MATQNRVEPIKCKDDDEIESIAVGVGLVGRSNEHRATLRTLADAAAGELEILLVGETGVGKELYARFAHACGPRKLGPMVPVLCGGISDSLFENEMFGHTRGAYTGADGASQGLVAEADGGILFLDEVDSLSPPNQVKLLRYLQVREYRRLGESRMRHGNNAVIAATNNLDLEQLCVKKEYRRDLYERLRTVRVDIPPLRARLDDMGMILNHFIDLYAEKYCVPPIVIAPCAWTALSAHRWPGNIRELENLVRCLTCRRRGGEICDKDLGLTLAAPPPGTPETPDNSEGLQFQAAKHQAVLHWEKGYLESVLKKAGGNISKAARMAGKDRRAFFELMRKNGVTV